MGKSNRDPFPVLARRVAKATRELLPSRVHPLRLLHEHLALRFHLRAKLDEERPERPELVEPALPPRRSSLQRALLLLVLLVLVEEAALEVVAPDEPTVRVAARASAAW